MSATTNQQLPTWQGEILRVPVPKTRDPFINTPFISLGRDASGEERFWISTWNSCVGCLGVMVTESGKARIYRFGSSRHGGFYSAVAEDADTLWLCGDLSRVVRLTLSTGEFTEYATGAPEALVFQGMVLDKVSGKLFVCAFPYTVTTAFSFNIHTQKTVQVHVDTCPERYMRYNFPNGDGSYSCILHTPGASLLRWDPSTEVIAYQRFADYLDIEQMAGGSTYSVIDDGTGHWYLPGHGWYDPVTQCVQAVDPTPMREMTWFARRGQYTWGTDEQENGVASIGIWDMTNGSVKMVCTIPDCSSHNINLTMDEKIVAVTIYGDFYRFDGRNGVLEVSKRLPTDAIGTVDCLCRIDDTRLLGTPFISQRFWEVNLRTKEGYDCGRAAPGAGEVLQTWKMGQQVYMAAYAGGELTEYNPEQHPHFPENPRVVADPPEGMRPVAGTDDGRHIYYSCSHPYGALGSVLTKYDTVTGMASYHDDPLPGQCLHSLYYDETTNSLLAGSTMHADCHSCPPTSERCYFARVDAETLEVLEQHLAPAGTEAARILGPMGEGRYLCTCHGPALQHTRWFILDIASITIPALEAMKTFPVGLGSIKATGKSGMYVLCSATRLELWDMRTETCVALLYDDFHGYSFEVIDDSVYIIAATEITVLEGCLKGFNQH